MRTNFQFTGKRPAGGHPRHSRCVWDAHYDTFRVRSQLLMGAEPIKRHFWRSRVSREATHICVAEVAGGLQTRSFCK